MRFAVLCLLFAAFPAVAHPPVSVVIDARGNVYYSDLEQVWRVAPDGTKSVAVPNVHTHELYLDAQGNLFGEHLWYEGERTDKWGHYVWKRDASGRVSTVIPRTEGFLKNYSFVRDAAGNMYWHRREVGQIFKRAPNGAVTRVVGELKGMGSFMHATRGGTLYVVDGGSLVRVREGRVVRLAQSIAKKPFGIWTDAAENVYVADWDRREVKRVTQAGAVSVFVKTTFPWSPIGGGFAANGDLWLLESTITNQVRVRRIGAAAFAAAFFLRSDVPGQSPGLRLERAPARATAGNHDAAAAREGALSNLSPGLCPGNQGRARRRGRTFES